MSPQKEGPYTKVGSIVGVLALLLAFSTWMAEKDGKRRTASVPREPTVREPSSSAPASPQGVVLDSSSPPPEETPAASRVAQALARPATPGPPVEVALHDGESRSVLGGQVSLGVAFNRIGEEEVATLRVNTPDGGSTPHAALSSGARFQFRLEGAAYDVDVLSIDWAEKTVTLKVARALSG